MDLMDRVYACWDALNRCTAETETGRDAVRYRDEQLPDMYDNNFTMVTATDTERAAQAIRAALAAAHAAGDAFCQVVVGPAVDASAWAGLLPAPSVMRLALFLSTDPSALSFPARADAAVRRVQTPADLEDRIAIERVAYGDAWGKDFLRRKGERFGAVYMGPAALDAYVCYDADGRPVGKADLLVHNQVAMIEDFDVLPEEQRKGYGTAVLRHLIDEAIARGANVVFMQTDLDDTAQDMYRKLGFMQRDWNTELWFDLKA